MELTTKIQKVCSERASALRLFAEEDIEAVSASLSNLDMLGLTKDLKAW